MTEINGRSQAVEVARRHGREPVVLVVLAAAAHDAGIGFRDIGNGVWLVDRVPPPFLDLEV